MKLSERMRHWPALTVHRVAEIEAVLVSMEERLTVLEPKKVEKPEVKPAPFVPISSFPPVPAPSTPIPEPSVLPASFEPVRLGPTPSTHDNPLDGTNLRT
jgi:hypothetical protein